jgi:NADPH-dependent curcumin reductase CurA
MPRDNKRIILAKRPDGLPTADCWALISDQADSPGKNEVLIDVAFISLDPAMRAWMNDYCYIGGVDIGETMRAFAIGTVLESQHPAHQPGDIVRGLWGVQRYAVANGDELEKITPLEGETLSQHLGIYGMTGLTAWAGITREVDVQPGQQVLVSSSAGAVGSAVAQIAKLKGARVVGIAGGPEKIDFCINTLGLDGCIDYKAEDLDAQLSEVMPNGVDIYFDCVGVPILDTVLNHINERSTILICGAINQFQQMDAVVGPSAYLRLPERHSTLKGFTYYHYFEEYEQATAQLREWINAGQLKFFEDIDQGLENFHDRFIKMFTGGNKGKLFIAP